MNLARTEFRPQGFYFPAGGASVYHVAAPGPVTLARLTRRAGTYRMVAFRAEFADLGARAHEVAAISQDNWPHAFAKFSCTPDTFIRRSTATTSTASTAIACANSRACATCSASSARCWGDRGHRPGFRHRVGARARRRRARRACPRQRRRARTGMGSSTSSCRRRAPRCGAEWALQHPGNWLEALETSVRDGARSARVPAADIVGLGIDFTACTVLPVNGRRASRSCTRRGFAGEPTRVAQAVEAPRLAAPGDSRHRGRGGARRDAGSPATAAGSLRNGCCRRPCRCSRKPRVSSRRPT